ncbi:M15 family metallopeptidase [Paenibacillus sp. RS8]|uniref:M15 family metallopeptidase n=1 Tax=Paenibacillus sp. RS8 TaxID=3242681 RepID=UPI0035C20A3B
MAITLEQVKAKSSVRISGLDPVVKAATVALIERCYARGVNIVITQGLRTIAEQDALYAQGRTKPGSIVTNAKGGTSYHNYGLAIDFALLLPDGKQVSWDLKRDGDGDKVADWTEVVQEAKALGFEWGGDFVSIKDAPHFQMTFELTTSQLRAGSKPSEIAMAKALAVIDRYLKECEDVRVDKANTVVNGSKLADGSVLIDGRVYVPLAAIGKAIGAGVTWDNVTKTATLTTKK